MERRPEALLPLCFAFTVNCITVTRSRGPLLCKRIPVREKPIGMDLSALSIAAALAAAGTLVFTVLLLLAQKLSTVPLQRAVFDRSATNSPAERLQRQWQSFGQRRALCLTPMLFLIICLATLLLAEPLTSVIDLTVWQQFAVLAAVALALATGVFRAVQYSLRRHRLQLRIDASECVAQVLRRLTANMNRTFHDVPCAFGIVDHVIVGINGIYAVKVIAHRPVGSKSLQLLDQELDFAEGKYQVSLKETRKITDRFARECAKVLKHDVHVRLIVAVPGWDIETQSDDNILIANERNLAMLTGWKDQRDHLMNEDAEALQRYLDERCARPA